MITHHTLVPTARARIFDDLTARPATPYHSMFCTCSRIWSISTFSSTAALDVRLSTDFDRGSAVALP